jgi:NAD/NADP transhydrogenase beta subunit
VILPHALAEIGYLVASACFIIGLKQLGSPATAPAGNRLSAWGMLIAVVVTLLAGGVVSWLEIVAGLVIGGGLGLWMARAVQMTAMPQMVAASVVRHRCWWPARSCSRRASPARRSRPRRASPSSSRS